MFDFYLVQPNIAFDWHDEIPITIKRRKRHSLLHLKWWLFKLNLHNNVITSVMAGVFS